MSSRAIEIVPYRTFGTRTRVHVRGRVLAARGISPHDGSSHWRNFVDTMRRLESDEIAHASLRLRMGGTAFALESDREGYYDAHLDLPVELDGSVDWHGYHIAMSGEAAAAVHASHEARGEILVVPPHASLGVISDIDDTVIRMQVDDPIALLRTTLLSHARTRTPFPGIADFLRALHRGTMNRERNPVFFVSSSPWNLYDLLTDFLDLHAIPRGPLLLRDYGLAGSSSLDLRHAGHKTTAIAGILDAHPRLPFVLLGDTSQEDPEIYLRIARERPDRIAAIYIRNVSGSAARRGSMAGLVAEAQVLGIPLLTMTHTADAARDAERRGLIASGVAERIAAGA